VRPKKRLGCGVAVLKRKQDNRGTVSTTTQGGDWVSQKISISSRERCGLSFVKKKESHPASGGGGTPQDLYVISTFEDQFQANCPEEKERVVRETVPSLRGKGVGRDGGGWLEERPPRSPTANRNDDPI